MASFSWRQRGHFLVLFEYAGSCLSVDHLKSTLLPFNFMSHTYFASFVSFFRLLLIKECLCTLQRSFHGPSHIPMYTFFVVEVDVTSHLYKDCLVSHLPLSGQSSLFLQLHLGVSFSFSFSSLLLCPLMICAMLLVHP